MNKIWKNKNLKKLCGGFTLIEMLVVIAIIGLLSSAVLIGLTPARKQARDTRRIADLRQIQNGLGVFYNAGQNYPPTLYDVLSDIPHDPLGGEYGYIQKSDQAYVLGACLENTRSKDIPTFAPADAYVYDVSPKNTPPERTVPPTCTCEDNNSYCVAEGIGLR